MIGAPTVAELFCEECGEPAATNHRGIVICEDCALECYGGDLETLLDIALSDVSEVRGAKS
jgi:hypothetical protein